MFLGRTATVDTRSVNTVVTPPVAPGLAVTVAEAREHLGYGTEVDAARDAELTGFIKAAQSAIEQYCNLTILTTVIRADRPEFLDRIVLPKRPFQSFGSVQYVRATDGEIITIDQSVYHVTRHHQLTAVVSLGADQSWPEDIAVRSNAARLTYTIGWAANAVPFDIRLAILMTVAKFDGNRGDCEEGGAGASVYAMKNANGSALPAAAAAMLSGYRLQRVAAI